MISAFSCRNESASENSLPERRISRNLLEEFDFSEKIYSTDSIDAGDPEHNSYFLSGWHAPEKTFRWAQGQKSTLRFYAAQPYDLSLETECRSIPAQENKKQKIKVFLNSKHIKTLKPELFFKVYKITFPKKYIKIGENTLAFEYVLSRRPEDFLNTDDHRLLSAAFKYFKFLPYKTELLNSHEFLLQKKSGEALHFPQSAFIFYHKVSGNEELGVSLSRLSENLKAHIEITSDEDLYTHQVFSKAHTKKIGLEEFSGHFIELAFYLEKRKKQLNSLQDFAVWSEIKISEPAPGPKPESKFRKLQAALQSEQFDVVYVVMDAFHAKHSNLYGYHRNTTPFLKKIGEQSIVFQNFYANSPYTLASTGTLLTSCYPHEHGLINKDTQLNPDLPRIQDILSRHSISSFLITGMPWFSKGWGLSEGFTEIFYNPYQLIFSDALASIYSHPEEENQKFIYIHFRPPHAPYLPPEEFRVFPTPGHISFNPVPQNFRKIETGEIRATDDLLDYIEAMYDANVLYADSLAEDIYHFFEQNNLLDQTILIFTSDHGEAVRMEHGKLGHNSTLFQEMIHIPFIMVFPEKLGLKPTTPQIPASVVDIPATLLDIFDIAEDYVFRGKSLLPFILSPEFTSSYVFLENFSANRKQKGIVGHQYKFIITTEDKMLFNLWDDPAEKINLYLEKQTVSGYFRQLLQKHSRGAFFESEKIDFEKIDKETRERLKSLGYIK